MENDLQTITKGNLNFSMKLIMKQILYVFKFNDHVLTANITSSIMHLHTCILATKNN